MLKWSKKVAVVTGASSEIGTAICKILVKHHLRVVGLARRTERIDDLSKTLQNTAEGGEGRLYSVRCDVTKEGEILRAFKWINDELGAVHVLVNNAALMRMTNLTDGNTDDWRRVFNVNVMALCICTREAIKLMTLNHISGHIIHMNLLLGPQQQLAANLGVFSASKAAVLEMTEGLRREVKGKVKVTSISSGFVKAALEVDNGSEDGGRDGLLGDDVAEAVVYVLSTRNSVEVDELTIRHLEE